MRLTEQELRMILDRTPGFWNSIAQRVIREARQQRSETSSSSGPYTDSAIARASTFALTESERSWRTTAGEIIERARGEGPRVPGPFDGSFEVKTIEPSREPKYLLPETRKAEPEQTRSTSSLSQTRAEAEARAVKLLLDKWNHGKKGPVESPRRILFETRKLARTRQPEVTE